MAKIRKYDITHDHLNRMLIPKKFWYAKLAEIPDECNHKEFVIKYIDKIGQNVDDGLGLLLWGDYGRGKSALGSIVLKAAATFGKLGLWVRAANLPKFIIEKVKFDSDILMSERILSVKILLLDEVLVRGDDRYSDTVIEDVVRERVNENLCTVITTNLSPDIFGTKYPALASVLKEAVYPVRVSGFDFRQQIRDDIEKEMS